jgi:hypothetical protein
MLCDHSECSNALEPQSRARETLQNMYIAQARFGTVACNHSLRGRSVRLLNRFKSETDDIVTSVQKNLPNVDQPVTAPPAKWAPRRPLRPVVAPTDPSGSTVRLGAFPIPQEQRIVSGRYFQSPGENPFHPSTQPCNRPQTQRQ